MMRDTLQENTLLRKYSSKKIFIALRKNVPWPGFEPGSMPFYEFLLERAL